MVKYSGEKATGWRGFPSHDANRKSTFAVISSTALFSLCVADSQTETNADLSWIYDHLYVVVLLKLTTVLYPEKCYTFHIGASCIANAITTRQQCFLT